MNIFLGLIGIGLGFVLIKYREQAGDLFGDPAWAGKIGGIYNVMIIVGILMFFWGVAMVTNTQDILFSPIINLFPQNAAPTGGLPGTEF